MQVLRHVEPALWWDIARNCSYATFFHTPLWNEIARRYQPHLRDRSVGFVTDSGTRAIFPLLETDHIGPFRRLISSFEGTYGGLIADGPLDPAEVQEIYRHLETGLKLSLHYLANPLAPRYPVEERLVYDQELTYLIHLDADFDTVFQRFAKNTRNAYRRGIREGVSIRRSGSLDDYRAYYAAYRDSIERWGYDTDYGYRWELFEHIYELERQHPDQIMVWITELDNQVVGGSITFAWNQHVTAWHASVNREALKRRAMVVLDTEITRTAVTRGYDYYDLNTSGKNQSLMDYKRSFGAASYPISMCKGESWMIRPALHIYHSIRSSHTHSSAEDDHEDERGSRGAQTLSVLSRG